MILIVDIGVIGIGGTVVFLVTGPTGFATYEELVGWLFLPATAGGAYLIYDSGCVSGWKPEN